MSTSHGCHTTMFIDNPDYLIPVLHVMMFTLDNQNFQAAGKSSEETVNARGYGKLNT